MKYRLQQSSLGVNLPLIAALCSLAVGLALVTLAALSSRHLQEAQQDVFGNALAGHLAQQVSGALETGDLLSLAATLQNFQGSSRAGKVGVFDVEGGVLGQAGSAVLEPQEYRSPIRVGSDVAGQAVVTLDGARASESRQRYLLSLSALAVMLSLLVFLLARYPAQRLVQRLMGVSGRLALDASAATAPPPQGEIALLEERAAALPMELLRAHTAAAPSREDHYRNTAVLYLHLGSLAGYIDTLNERNLHRYTDRLHRIVYAAAACYAGTLQVARPFGLILCFGDEEGRGSALVRAASCAWLIRSVSRELEKSGSLSFSIGMAIGNSELGPGDSSDIYPGLYMQSIMDELRSACLDDVEHILLAPSLADAPELTGNVRVRKGDGDHFGTLVSFASPHAALLERQRELLLNRLRRRPARQDQ
ncbi:hypothetical protein [Chromatocurvus halotolerans]|uniref:hypothetical protein n=1 Tax=Chromatocurvus halotolerans TaxID=1132028 RepID=UPI0013C2D534|nr:hypothetical protein [Chromatocurvus halotolerans]